MAQLVANVTPNRLQPYTTNATGTTARTLAFEMAPNLTVARGTLMGQITANGKATPYASGNSDGSQVPVGPAEFDFTTDANGNVVLGLTGAVADLTRTFEKTSTVFITGDFLLSDLVGYDTNALAAIKGRLLGVGARQFLHLP